MVESIICLTVYASVLTDLFALTLDSPTPGCSLSSLTNLYDFDCRIWIPSSRNKSSLIKCLSGDPVHIFTDIKCLEVVFWELWDVLQSLSISIIRMINITRNPVVRTIVAESGLHPNEFEQHLLLKWFS